MDWDLTVMIGTRDEVEVDFHCCLPPCLHKLKNARQNGVPPCFQPKFLFGHRKGLNHRSMEHLRFIRFVGRCLRSGQTRQAIAVSMLLGPSELNIVHEGTQEQTPALNASCCGKGYCLPRVHDVFQRLMICN